VFVDVTVIRARDSGLILLQRELPRFGNSRNVEMSSSPR